MKEMWCVTYQYHDNNENFTNKNVFILAESIGEAISYVADILDNEMQNNGWSDYHVTSVNIVPELH